MVKLNSPRGIRLGMLGAMVGALLAWLAQRTSERPTARHAPDKRQQAMLDLERLADNGLQGARRIAQAMSSPSASTRAAAGRVISEKLKQWQTLPADQAAAKIRALAGALAVECRGFDAESRNRAREFALEILAWRIRAGGASGAEITASCDDILQTCEAHTISLVAKNQTPLHPSIVDRALAAAPKQRSLEPLGVAHGLPGGDLPIEFGAAATIEAEQPAKLASDENAQPLNSAASLAHRGHAIERRNDQPPGGEQNRGDATNETPEPGPMVRRIAAQIGESDENARTMQLMRQLHDSDPRAVDEAMQALKKRGFSSAHLELAWQLTAGDPAVRQTLAEMLPRVPDIDVETWLLWLSKDAEPQVRLTALSVMASTGDPKMLKRVARMATEDPDPTIQEQAERIASGVQAKK